MYENISILINCYYNYDMGLHFANNLVDNIKHIVKNKKNVSLKCKGKQIIWYLLLI
jgi:hypothetical protein